MAAASDVVHDNARCSDRQLPLIHLQISYQITSTIALLITNILCQTLYYIRLRNSDPVSLALDITREAPHQKSMYFVSHAGHPR